MIYEVLMNKLKNIAIKLPVVVILGSTGCGKSKLAIELAKMFNGEIISADSMQVYEGLDIITNKVTKEEQQMVPHHLLNFINPLERFTVVDFANLALPLIDELIAKGKIPFIVGGTYYYVESLLWKMLVSKLSSDKTLIFNKEKQFLQAMDSSNNPNCLKANQSVESFTSIQDGATLEDNRLKDANGEINLQSIFQKPITADGLLHISSQKLHELLVKVDPRMANRLHPNEKRKIIRSLQVYQQHGVTHSEILDAQHAESGGCTLSGPLRFKNTCVLYLKCDPEVLAARLDSRVEEMMKQGLIKELQDFHKEYNLHRLHYSISPAYTTGIFQSIGFKEFHEFLILPDDEKETESGMKLLKKGIEDMKLVTKRYSRLQGKWILNRFLKRDDRELPLIYGLDVTDLNKWEENVLNPSIEIMNAFVKNSIPDIDPLPIQKRNDNEMKTFFCEECEKTLIGSLVWHKHLSSRGHRKNKKRKQKEQLNIENTENYVNEIK